MKTLTIVRHAKSDWTHYLPDHDRPLNKRGKSDLPMVADRLNQLGCKPQVCYYSTALKSYRYGQWIVRLHEHRRKTRRNGFALYV